MAAKIKLGAAADQELGGVPDPPLIGPLGRELAVEDIAGDRLIVITHRRGAEALPHPGPEPLRLHQPRDPLPADRNALLDQILEHPRAPVCAATPLMRGPNQDAQLTVAQGMR